LATHQFFGKLGMREKTVSLDAIVGSKNMLLIEWPDI
jgi:hypothetical protein